MAHQGVAVGVEAARLHRHEDVARPDPAGPQQPVGLHHPGGRPGDVVVVGTEEPRVLGGLAADQRAAGLDAGLGDALDDGRDPLGYDAAGGDVVGHEEGLGAADDQVVDDHADQVEPDRVVDVHGLGDGDLGADAVGGGGEQRAFVAGQHRGVEESGEAADARRSPRAAAPCPPSPSSARSPCRRPRSRPRPPRRRWRSRLARARRGGCGTVFSYGLGSGSASEVIEVSSRCLPSRLSSGRSMGYSPVKQAWQRRSDGWAVASTIPSREM